MPSLFFLFTGLHYCFMLDIYSKGGDNKMKQQTYITKLLDNNNKMVNFERWADKKIKTVEKKVKELYTKYYYVYKADIKKSTYLAIYEASNNEKQTEVKRVLINEFLA